MLFKKFDKLLNSVLNELDCEKKKLVFLSCDFYNTIKIHPEYLKKKNKILNIFFLNYLIYFLRECIKICIDILININFSENKYEIKKNNRVLFISHLTKSNSNINLYYGNLNIINNSIIYYINHVDAKNFSNKNVFLNTDFDLGLKKEILI